MYHTFLVQGGGLSPLLFILALEDEEGLKFNVKNRLLFCYYDGGGGGDDDDDDDDNNNNNIHVLKM